MLQLLRSIIHLPMGLNLWWQRSRKKSDSITQGQVNGTILFELVLQEITYAVEPGITACARRGGTLETVLTSG